MLLIAAVHVVNHRRRRAEIRTIPIARAPLWYLIADDARDALRNLRYRLGLRSRGRLRRSGAEASAPGRRTHNR
jgi:hypothetical protein